jgi:hypothetical protein
MLSLREFFKFGLKLLLTITDSSISFSITVRFFWKYSLKQGSDLLMEIEAFDVVTVKVQLHPLKHIILGKHLRF